MKTALPWLGSFFCMPYLLKKVVWKLHGLYWGNLVTTMTSSLGMISLRCQLKELLIKYVLFVFWSIQIFQCQYYPFIYVFVLFQSIHFDIHHCTHNEFRDSINTVYAKTEIFYFWCLFKPFMVSSFSLFCCCVVIIYVVHSLAYLCH